MKRNRLLLFAITLALTTVPSAQSFAEEDSSKILKEILFELKEIKNELRNSLVIQNKSQLLLHQIEYQRQLLNQNLTTEEALKKEIEGIENATSEVGQRLDEIKKEMSSRVIINTDDASSTEYNNLVAISDQQQKQLALLKNKLNGLNSTTLDINKTINELLVKYKNSIQSPN